MDYMKALKERFLTLFIIALGSIFSVYSQTQQNSELQVVSQAESCNYPFNVRMLVKLDALTLANSLRIEWDFKDGGTQTQEIDEITDTITHTFANPGNYSVVARVIKNKGDITLGTTIIIAEPDDPVINVVPQISCNGKITFNESSIDNGLSTDLTRDITWDFGDGNSNSYTRSSKEDSSFTYTYVSGSADTTYNVKVIVRNLCGIDSTTTTVRIIKYTPEITFQLPACTNSDVSFSAVNLPANIDFDYLWNFGDGSAKSTAISPLHSYTTTGAKNVVLQIGIVNGDTSCIKQADTVVTVLESPSTSFDTSYTLACDSFTVNLTNNSTKANRYKWQFGRNAADSSKIEDPLPVLYNTPGLYILSLTAYDDVTGCSLTKSDTIIVPATPVADFNATSVCQGALASFIDASTLSYGSITQWSWELGESATSNNQNPTHIYNTNGNITVRLNVRSGICQDDTFRTLVITPKPVAAFTPLNTAGCPPLTVPFVHQNDPYATDYLWTFGNGDSADVADTIYTYENPFGKDTVFQVTLIAMTQSGCSDTATSKVTVYRPPVADFTSDIKARPDCGPDTIHFFADVQGPTGTTYEWNFDDGSAINNQANPVNVFSNDSLYPMYFNIRLTAVTPGPYFCRDTSEMKVLTIYPKPNTNFAIDTLRLCPPAIFRFWAPPSSNATYIWDFGNNNRVVPVTDSYIRTFDNISDVDVPYSIKLITNSEFGCTDSTEKTLNVPPAPKALFNVLPSYTQEYPNVNFAFTNQSVNQAAWEYNWNFGENTDTMAGYGPHNHAYQAWGIYKVTLNINSDNGCSDDTIQQVTITPPPARVGFVIDNTNGCPPLTVVFRDTSYATDTISNRWDFGDGSYATGTTVSHVYYSEGAKVATLYTKDLFGNDISVDKSIEIFRIPSSSFTVVPQHPEVNTDPVYGIPNFPDTTEGGEQYLWNFGDGRTSEDQRPSHIYQDTGHFAVSLTVTSVHNCVSTDSVVNAVEPQVYGVMSFPNAFMPNMTGSQSGVTDENTLDNFVFLPFSSGVTQYKLEIYNRWGELLFTSANKNEGWNGYYKGKLCKQDVYVWKVTGKYATGKAFSKTGNVTLLHSKL
jgi:gliding motility-associated-like protein